MNKDVFLIRSVEAKTQLESRAREDMDKQNIYVERTGDVADIIGPLVMYTTRQTEWLINMSAAIIEGLITPSNREK